MADFYRDIVKLLRAAGCHYVRPAKGDHQWWYSPITKRHFALDYGIKSHDTANAVLKQAGLPKPF